MLAVTFKLAKSNPFYGASLLLAYGIGHCAVIVVAGTFTEIVERFLNWNEQSKGVVRLSLVRDTIVTLDR
jgi:cytochrome c-type biogenesis protein